MMLKPASWPRALWTKIRSFGSGLCPQTLEVSIPVSELDQLITEHDQTVEQLEAATAQNQTLNQELSKSKAECLALLSRIDIQAVELARLMEQNREAEELFAPLRDKFIKVLINSVSYRRKGPALSAFFDFIVNTNAIPLTDEERAMVNEAQRQVIEEDRSKPVHAIRAAMRAVADKLWHPRQGTSPNHTPT